MHQKKKKKKKNPKPWKFILVPKGLILSQAHNLRPCLVRVKGSEAKRRERKNKGKRKCVFECKEREK